MTRFCQILLYLQGHLVTFKTELLKVHIANRIVEEKIYIFQPADTRMNLIEFSLIHEKYIINNRSYKNESFMPIAEE